MIKLAVVGCGRWGINHVRVLNECPDSTVTSIADTDFSRLAQISKIFQGVQVEVDYRRVLENPEIDAVVVATPTITHYEISRKALLAGKHVLCEKPLCTTSKEAEELIRLADKNKKILMVGHVFLFNSGIKRTKEIIGSGELGKINCLTEIHTNLGPIRKDVNVAYDLATHGISMFNWMLESQPIAVSAQGAAFVQTGIEDIVFAWLEYPNRVFASIQASWLHPNKVRQMSIAGSQKMLLWNDLDLNRPLAIYDRYVAQALPDSLSYGDFLRAAISFGNVIRVPKVQSKEPLKEQDQAFLNAIRKGCLEQSDGNFGLGVVKTLESIAISLKTQGNNNPLMSELRLP